MELLFRFIMYTLCILIGGYWISDAVKEFKVKKYYKFGVDIMVVIYDVILLAQIMLTDF